MNRKEINLELNIKPKSLKRPMVTNRGTFYKKEHQLEMTQLQNAILNALNDRYNEIIKSVMEKPKNRILISIELIFNINMPNSFSKLERKMYKGKGHNVKPDFDNLAKNILDRGNGILWIDDCLIWESKVRKIWSDFDKVTINIEYEVLNEWKNVYYIKGYEEKLGYFEKKHEAVDKVREIKDIYGGKIKDYVIYDEDIELTEE